MIVNYHHYDTYICVCIHIYIYIYIVHKMIVNYPRARAHDDESSGSETRKGG